MSSIDNKKARDRIRKLFYEKLLPLSDKIGTGGGYFPLGPDPAADTYFTDRPARRMSRADFEEPACADEKEFAKRMAALWGRTGNPELARLASAFAECAALLYTPEEIDDEVSPFIYVMF